MSDRKNSEGYSDPTAYQAMMNLEIEELRFRKLLRSIKDVCDLADFEIEGRVGLDEYGGRKMFNFPTEDIVKAFEAFSEAINQLAADIVDAWEAVTVTVSAVLDDDALWPNRYGMPPKKYGQSLQKHSKKSFKQYDYIPIMAKNLPYQRRAF